MTALNEGTLDAGRAILSFKKHREASNSGDMEASNKALIEYHNYTAQHHNQLAARHRGDREMSKAHAALAKIHKKKAESLGESVKSKEAA